MKIRRWQRQEEERKQEGKEIKGKKICGNKTAANEQNVKDRRKYESNLEWVFKSLF